MEGEWKKAVGDGGYVWEPCTEIELTIKQPEFTYDFRFAPGDGFVFGVLKPPCAFHRWMQRALLGIRWRKK